MLRLVSRLVARVCRKMWADSAGLAECFAVLGIVDCGASVV
jgi:hypothetical protein